MISAKGLFKINEQSFCFLADEPRFEFGSFVFADVYAFGDFSVEGDE